MVGSLPSSPRHFFNIGVFFVLTHCAQQACNATVKVKLERAYYWQRCHSRAVNFAQNVLVVIVGFAC